MEITKEGMRKEIKETFEIITNENILKIMDKK
jgi:hypothetical protein